MTMAKLDELRGAATFVVTEARLHCPERCGTCVWCKDVEEAENIVLTALQEWWKQGCKEV